MVKILVPTAEQQQFLSLARDDENPTIHGGLRVIGPGRSVIRAPDHLLRQLRAWREQRNQTIAVAAGHFGQLCCFAHDDTGVIALVADTDPHV